MSVWSNSIKRSNTDEVRREDDITLTVKEFFDNQPQVKSYTIRQVKPDWYVDVDGDVHIYPRDINEGGTFAFKLGDVSGSLVSHCKNISPALLPTNLAGEIVFDNEDICANCSLRKSAGQTGSAAVGNADSQQEDAPDGLNGMELLKTNPPKESDIKKKIEGLISDCFEYGYDIDFDAIRKTIEEQKNNSENYNLRINIEFTKGSKHLAMKNKEIERLDIYISDNDDDLLNLSAIEKATYLTFLFYNDGNGIVIEDMKKDFIELMSSIYKRLPGREIKFNDENNITYGNLTLNTLAGYRNAIRNAIKEKLRYNGLVNEFSIEGYKNQPFRISKSTEEIRNLIREVFVDL